MSIRISLFMWNTVGFIEEVGKTAVLVLEAVKTRKSENVQIPAYENWGFFMNECWDSLETIVNQSGIGPTGRGGGDWDNNFCFSQPGFKKASIKQV